MRLYSENKSIFMNLWTSCKANIPFVDRAVNEPVIKNKYIFRILFKQELDSVNIRD